MDKRLFDFDPISGSKKIWHYDSDKDEAIIETVVDATKLVETNKAMYNSHDERANWKGDMHLVASIPMELYMKWKAEGKLEDQAFMKRWLNDPDNRLFRTRPGEV
jgi:hypothetical protein